MVGIDSKVLIRVTNKWGRLGRITQIIRNSAGTIIKYEVTMEPDGMDPEKIMMPVADAVDRNTVWQAYRMNLMCDPKHDLMITYERDDGVKCWCRGTVMDVKLTHYDGEETFTARAWMDDQVFYLTYQEVSQAFTDYKAFHKIHVDGDPCIVPPLAINHWDCVMCNVRH